MVQSRRSFIPAAGRDWRLPFYDLLAKALGADQGRRRLVEGSVAGPSARLLEIGCGTGSLLVLLKEAHPGAEVVGLDPDANALARARRKAERASVTMRFDQGFADTLPYDDASFDRVFSSLMFHHLSLREREESLREVRRVLRPGGRLHLLDFAGPSCAAEGRIARRIHSSDQLKDNDEEVILRQLSAAGLTDAVVSGRFAARFAHMVTYEAAAPEAGAAT